MIYWSVADAWVSSNRHYPNRMLLESDGMAAQYGYLYFAYLAVVA